MVGLRFSQTVQDCVESFLVEQGPLRHSRVTSGTPVHPLQGLSPTIQPPLAPALHAQSRDKVPHMQRRGGGYCHQPWPGAEGAASQHLPVPPTL